MEQTPNKSPHTKLRGEENPPAPPSGCRSRDFPMTRTALYQLSHRSPLRSRLADATNSADDSIHDRWSEATPLSVTVRPTSGSEWLGKAAEPCHDNSTDPETPGFDGGSEQCLPWASKPSRVTLVALPFSLVLPLPGEGCASS